MLQDTIVANEKVADSQAKTNKNLQEEIAKRRLILDSQIAQTAETKKQAEEAGRYAEKQRLLDEYYSQTIENLREEIQLRKENGEGVDELIKKIRRSQKGSRESKQRNQRRHQEYREVFRHDQKRTRR